MASELSDADFQRFKLKRGDAAGQAVWEALAELVAARAWAHVWAGQPWNIAVRGDSQAALGALGKLRSVRSASINAIARELAHDLSRSPHRIRVRDHLPGKENVLADFLSRLFQPGAAREPPVCLDEVEWTEASLRDDSWWLTWPEDGSRADAPVEAP